ALAALDRSLPVEGRLFDLGLDEAALDRLDGATELVDARDQVRRAPLEVVRQRLDEVRAAERVSSVGRAALGCENLLCAKGELRGMLGRQGECLVERVRVQRLRAAADGRERLEGDAHDVVLRLLRGQRRASGLSVEA